MPAPRIVQLDGGRVAATLGRCLVLAPHPDDETLGCGGLIALLARARAALQVVLVSDGAASHPRSLTHPPARLRALRRQEMAAALNALGCPAASLAELGLPDGAVPGPGGSGYGAALVQLGEIMNAFRPDTVLLPCRHDAHPDHRASHALGRAACQRWARQARQLEYLVWPPDDSGGWQHTLQALWQIDIDSVLDRKRLALLQHHSQLGQVVQDDPCGFTLPEPLRAASLCAVETFYAFEPELMHDPPAHPAADLFR